MAIAAMFAAVRFATVQNSGMSSSGANGRLAACILDRTGPRFCSMTASRATRFRSRKSSRYAASTPRGRRVRMIGTSVSRSWAAAVMVVNR